MKEDLGCVESAISWRVCAGGQCNWKWLYKQPVTAVPSAACTASVESTA